MCHGEFDAAAIRFRCAINGFGALGRDETKPCRRDSRPLSDDEKFLFHSAREAWMITPIHNGNGSGGVMKNIRIVSVVLLMLSSNTWADAYDDGVAAYQSGNFQDALGIWTSLARDGHVNSEFQLGVMYEYGDGVSADQNIALEWYQRAAEHGHQQAQEFVSILRAIHRGAPNVPVSRKPMRIA